MLILIVSALSMSDNTHRVSFNTPSFAVKYEPGLKERYRVGQQQNREDHRFTLNLHGLMMMTVENIP